MASVVTKKVRFKSPDARRLRGVAKDLGMTESEVLRRGFDLMEGVRDRRQNVEKLIAILGDAPEPRKIRPRVKW